MAKTAKIAQLAEHAGVSTATVDRVLHGRGGYSARSYEAVSRAIEALGYGTLADHLVQKQKSYNFTVFLPALDNAFRQSIIAAAQQYAAAIPGAHINLSFGDINLIGGQGTIDALRAVDPAKTDAVSLFAVDAPGVRDEIDRLVDIGVTVCTIVSDVPSSRRFAYIGLDNVAAGRTAGRMIHRMAPDGPGTVGVITGSNEIRDHLERYMGFSQALTMYRPEARVLPAMEGFSFNETCADMVEKLLRENDDLLGLYSIAGGSAGVIDGLRRVGKPAGLVVAVHELEPVVRDALLDNTIDLVLHQSPQDMMRIALRTLANACEGKPPEPERMTIELFIAENLP